MIRKGKIKTTRRLWLQVLHWIKCTISFTYVQFGETIWFNRNKLNTYFPN